MPHLEETGGERASERASVAERAGRRAGVWTNRVIRHVGMPCFEVWTHRRYGCAIRGGVQGGAPGTPLEAAQFWICFEISCILARSDPHFAEVRLQAAVSGAEQRAAARGR